MFLKTFGLQGHRKTCHRKNMFTYTVHTEKKIKEKNKRYKAVASQKDFFLYFVCIMYTLDTDAYL